MEERGCGDDRDCGSGLKWCHDGIGLRDHRNDLKKMEKEKIGGVFMEKEKIINLAVEEFKKLKPENKMFVLGYMQGTIANQKQTVEKAKTA